MSSSLRVLILLIRYRSKKRWPMRTCSDIIELENTDATLVFTNNATNILFVALAMNYFRSKLIGSGLPFPIYE